MIRVLVWEPGEDRPRSEMIDQIKDRSPALALLGGEDFPVGLDQYIDGTPERIYLGRLDQTHHWGDIAAAYVVEDGVPRGLRANVYATEFLQVLGIHPMDVPSGGLRGTVVITGLDIDKLISHVHPAVVTGALETTEGVDDSIGLPPGLTIPPGVVVDTPQLFGVTNVARRAGCDLLIPDWVGSLLVGDVHHVISNQTDQLHRTISGVPFLRCHALLAMYVDEEDKAQPFPTWLDIPLGHYILLPVPSSMDPTHPDFDMDSKHNTRMTVTVGDLTKVS